MDEDLRIRWSEFQPYQRHLYTQQGARQSAIILFVLLFGPFVMVFMIVCRKTIRQPKGFRNYLGKRLFPGFACCVAISLGIFAAMPRLEPGETQLIKGFGSSYHPYSLNNFFYRQIRENPAILRRSEQEIGETLSNLTTDVPGFLRSKSGKYSNPIQGGDITVSATPGHFTVEKRDGEVILRVFDKIGIPVISKYKVPPDEPEPSVAPLTPAS